MSRAGSRVPRFRPGYGRMSEKRVAWLTTVVTGTISLLSIDVAEVEDQEEVPFSLSSEPGESKIVVVSVPGRSRPLYWNLSGMTVEELNATRAFFEMAFDQAEPVARLRDKVAADALAEGDDSYQRVYRQVPQFIVREGKVPRDGEGVRERPEDDAQGAGDQLGIEQ